MCVCTFILRVVYALILLCFIVLPGLNSLCHISPLGCFCLGRILTATRIFYDVIIMGFMGSPRDLGMDCPQPRSFPWLEYTVTDVYLACAGEYLFFIFLFTLGISWSFPAHVVSGLLSSCALCFGNSLRLLADPGSLVFH